MFFFIQLFPMKIRNLNEMVVENIYELFFIYLKKQQQKTNKTIRKTSYPLVLLLFCVCPVWGVKELVFILLLWFIFCFPVILL